MKAKTSLEEMKERVRRLEASEKSYRMLFEKNIAGVFRTRKNGVVLDCNQSFANLLGYGSAKEAKEHNAREFYFDVADRNNYVKELTRKGNVSNFRMRLKRKDGMPVWVLFNSTLIEDDGEKAIQGTMIDITSMVEVEKTLRKAKKDVENLVEQRSRELLLEKKFISDVVESMAKGLVVFDTKLRLINTNGAFCRLTGFSRDELTLCEFAQPFFDLRGGDAKIKKIITGDYGNSELVLKRKDGGQAMTIFTPSRILDENGKVAAYVGIVRDITEEKRLEHEREAIRKRLAEYAKRLEVKVRRLEGESFKLTENEKRVLNALFCMAEAGDREIAKATGIKRPTVTAIRNKAFREKWVRRVNVPNLEILGFKLIEVSYGKTAYGEFERKFKVSRQMKETENVFFESTDDEFVSVSFYKYFSDAQIYDALRGNPTKKTEGVMKRFFPVKIKEAFEFCECIARDFSADSKMQAQAHHKAKKPLKENEKAVLLELVKEPSLLNSGLASRTGISLPTAAKIRKKLVAQGYLIARVVPNFKKLGQSLVLLHVKLSEKAQKSEKEHALKKIMEKVCGFFSVESGGELIAMCAMRDVHERTTELRNFLGELERENMLEEQAKILVLATGKLRFHKLDFSEVLEKSYNHLISV